MSPPRRGARLSIVMPVLDEAAGIERSLGALAPLRRLGHEVLVIDGGSRDDTLARAVPLADRVATAARGRASQMNAGAALARGDVLLFLHADTQLPPGAERAIEAAMSSGARWGRFDVRIAGRSRLLPLVAASMNWRSRLTGIATGDQAIFVERRLFEELGGYAAQPLMEDIEFARRLRAASAPACLRERVTTSGRRWDQRGAWRTIVLMWSLRWRYWLGASPEALAREYR
jgi:rSAM/selenodomain-associated transferase 2